MSLVSEQILWVDQMSGLASVQSNKYLKWHHDTQINDIQRKEIQHNDTKQNDIQHSNKSNVTHNIIPLRIMSERCYAKCHKFTLYAECCHAKCHHAECHGTSKMEGKEKKEN